MYIKLDRNGFKTIERLMPTMEAERLAVRFFRAQNIEKSACVFAAADISLKISKALLSCKSKVTLTNTEACVMLWYCATKETSDELQFDYYAQNVVRQVKISLHEQLTNYRSKY